MICDLHDNIEFDELKFIDNKFCIKMTVCNVKKGFNGEDTIRTINRDDAIQLIEHLKNEFKIV